LIAKTQRLRRRRFAAVVEAKSKRPTVLGRLHDALHHKPIFKEVREKKVK
jgi:hypothetical protein